MASKFFHAQAPIIQPIQPHHDHSYSASGLTTFMGSRKGKARVDSLPSHDEIAYLMQWEQFNQWLSIMADAKLAKSTHNINGALVANDAYLNAFITAKEAAVEDRIAPGLLSRDKALPVPKSRQTRLELPDFIMNPEPLKMPGMEDTQARPDASSSDKDKTVYNESMDNGQVESDNNEILVFSTAQLKRSNAVGKRYIAGSRANRNKLVNCVSCLESCSYFETVKTPCDHYYCRDCLVALVEAFTLDESLFPLRCCKDPLPVADVLPILSLPLRSLFERKIAEFSIFAGDRLHCSNPNCAAFLGSSEGRLSASAIKCPHCLVNTCPRCKEPAHPGEGCGVGALQALAVSEDWQTCPGCKTVVELNQGCNHITCRCKTQFCYLCAALWKTCKCDQYNR